MSRRIILDSSSDDDEDMPISPTPTMVKSEVEDNALKVTDVEVKQESAKETTSQSRSSRWD